MREKVLRYSPFLLSCMACGTGLSAGTTELRKHIRHGNWVCDSCKSETPVEQAYLKSLNSPGKNCIFLSNYTEVGELDVPGGLMHEVGFREQMDEVVWLTVTPNVNYCVSCDVQNQRNNGFSFLTTYCHEKDMLTRKDKVKVVWAAHGYMGESLLHLKLLRRAFKFLWQVNEWARDYRIILLEGIIAFEAFAAWFVREHLFVDDYFKASKEKSKKIDEFMRAEGIYSITDVVIRSAIREVDIHWIFKLLKLPTNDSLFNTDYFLDSILKGISIRNKIVHKGLVSVEKDQVRKILVNIYFLVEAVMLNYIDAEQIRKVFKPLADSEP